MEVPPAIAGHVVAMPYPGRGHINPMINLCKLLISRNADILVTFVVTEEWLALLGSEPKPDNFRFSTMPNVIPSEQDRGRDLLGFIGAVQTKMETPFDQLLDRLEKPPTLIIYDTFLFWVVEVGNRRNIPVASFWTMSASVFSALQHYRLLEQNGDYPVNLLENGEKRVNYVPGIYSMRLADFPLNGGDWRSRQMLEWALQGFLLVRKAQYLILPSIYELEPQAVDALKSELSLPIYTIGPVIPHFFGFGDNSSLITTQTDDQSYFKWLSNQPPASVLYISHGSFLSLSTAQIDELAAGLRDSGVRFLWISRKECSRLQEICGNMGLVLEWCDQMRVLLHPAIGGFWSHCGWNSTREGVLAGVPFLTFPLIPMDQPINSKLIVEDWKVGWRVKNEVQVDTLVRKDEITRLLQNFMDLDSNIGRDMRARARELQRICLKAIANAGSSETDINVFVREICLQRGVKAKP